MDEVGVLACFGAEGTGASSKSFSDTGSSAKEEERIKKKLKVKIRSKFSC